MKITATVTVTAVVATGLMWSSIQSQVAYERTQAITAATARNENLAVAFDQFVTRTLQAAGTITEFVRSEVDTAGPSVALDLLRRSQLVEDGFFDGVGVLDASGRLIATAERGSWPDLNFSEREHFRVHTNANSVRLAIGKPVESKILKTIVIPVTRRINNREGGFAGVVIVQIAPERFLQFFQGAGVKPNDYVALIGMDGVVRAARSNIVNIVGRDVGSTTLFAAAKKAEVGTVQTTGKAFGPGQPRYVSFRRLKNFPLFVAVSTSKETVLAETEQRHKAAVFLGVAVTIGIVLLTGLLILVTRRKDIALAAALTSKARLRAISVQDPLTRCLNRYGLEEEVASILRGSAQRGERLACLFIDLDNFKGHNDTYGHALGDQILVAFASKLELLLPDGAVIGRLGGDEFIALVHEDDPAAHGILLLCENIITSFRMPILFEPCEITVTASIGISLFPEHGTTFSDLLRHADIAMYTAKHEGRSTYRLYALGGGKSLAETVHLEEQLRKAVRQGQFELHYQPKIDMRTGASIGFEALIRWPQPDATYVSPGVFIPVAERSGLILPISDWVLRATCRQIRAWTDGGANCGPIAVNISPLQFRQADFVAKVSGVLAETGVSASSLELEITESMVIDHPEDAIEKLKALKAIGLRLALDDFGTGYSNLQYLKRFPLDSLKVDQSFIRDLMTSNDAKVIAGAIINLGKNLGLTVVAEGVEHHAQVGFLLSQGCSACQGFLFAKPMPAEECMAWFAQSIDSERQRVFRSNQVTNNPPH